MTQPDGSKCLGVWVPPNAVPEHDEENELALANRALKADFAAALRANGIAVRNLLDRADSGMPIISEDIRALLPPNAPGERPGQEARELKP